MHELSLVNNIVSILDKEVEHDDIGQVKKIFLEVGELRYVVPEIMISCFEQVPKNPKLENAAIEIEVMPVRIRCLDCGAVLGVEDNHFICTKCSSSEVDIISGNEFNIKGIEW